MTVDVIDVAGVRLDSHVRELPGRLFEGAGSGVEEWVQWFARLVRQLV